MHYSFPVLLLILLSAGSGYGQTTQRVYLSGTDKDHTETWEFRVDGGRRSGEWSTIEVPSHWEQQGFGTYSYGHKPETHPKEAGNYRYRFTPEPGMEGKHVNLVFDGVMTDADVRLNGESVGAVHQGSFYRFRYDITDRLRYGEENLLEVAVKKQSDEETVNEAERYADYWIFGGIFRPVWLEVLPEQHLRHFAVDARADGNFTLDLDLSEAPRADRVKLEFMAPDGERYTQEFLIPAGRDSLRVAGRVETPLTWTSETPHLYDLTVTLLEAERILHTVSDRIGFRTVALRDGDGLYVNGQKIRMKGVNRHSWWPETGRTLSHDVHVLDVNLIKEMNMNAVRMSHYPPDEDFLRVTDSLGLYVIDELAGWQQAYGTEVGERLVPEMVERDVNHPSIVLWSNGNEGGNNHALDTIFGDLDPQQRRVIHPWADFNGTDTKHYKDYGCCATSLFGGTTVFFPTEFLHGMYDGGHGAGLDDYWQAMLRHPQSAGAFLWDLVDQGIVRTDLQDSIDTNGNAGADGIVGPHREREASFYSIREIWSPVQLGSDRVPFAPQSSVTVTNQYAFSDLNTVTFSRVLLHFGSPFDEAGETVVDSTVLKSISAPPASSASLDLALPADRSSFDAVRLTAMAADGKPIMQWVLPSTSPTELAGRFGEGRMVITQVVEESREDTTLTLSTNTATYTFSTRTGYLTGGQFDGHPVPITNGPQLATDTAARATSFTTAYTPEGTSVSFTYPEGGLEDVTWTVTPDGRLLLDYAYLPTYGRRNAGGNYPYLGINFSVPESGLSSVRYLGDGPYRVYKNRRRGPQLGVYDKAFNDAITGMRWEYPEFKGYFQNLYWMEFKYGQAPGVTVISHTPELFVRLFTPGNPPDARPGTIVPYPSGDVSFLHAIPAIGTKFKNADQLGPASQLNQHSEPGKAADVVPYRGRLEFVFE